MEKITCFIIGLFFVLLPIFSDVGHKKEKSEIVYVNTSFNKVICENEETYAVPKEKIDSGFYKIGEQYEYDSFSWIGITLIIIGAILMVIPLADMGGFEFIGDILEGILSHH